MSYTDWLSDNFSFLFDAGIDGFDWTHDPTTPPPSPSPIPFPNIGAVTFFEIGDVIDFSGDSGVVIIAAQDADTDLTITINQDGETASTGTVKFFNPTKGFGFITPEDGSRDVFDTVIHTSILTGNGNDAIDVNVSGGLFIDAGGGNDDITAASIDNSWPAKWEISAGDGNDRVAHIPVHTPEWTNQVSGDPGAVGATISGGNGNDDLLALLVGPGDFGTVRVSGDAGSDNIYLTHKFENVVITSFQYSISGSVSGGAGPDVIILDEPVNGSTPFDVSGNTGDDILRVNMASARVSGGQDNDMFVFNAGDNSGTITDYTDGADSFGLMGGLTYNDLKIYEADGQTYLTEMANGAVLGILAGSHAAELDTSDFAAVTIEPPTLPGDSTSLF